MITRFEATVTLLGGILGMLVMLVTLVWKARGYVDRLNTTDGRLADAIDNLASVQQQQHQENQARFERLERRLKIS